MVYSGFRAETRKDKGTPSIKRYKQAQHQHPASSHTCEVSNLEQFGKGENSSAARTVHLRFKGRQWDGNGRNTPLTH